MFSWHAFVIEFKILFFKVSSIFSHNFSKAAYALNECVRANTNEHDRANAFRTHWRWRPYRRIELVWSCSSKVRANNLWRLLFTARLANIGECEQVHSNIDEHKREHSLPFAETYAHIWMNAFASVQSNAFASVRSNTFAKCARGLKLFPVFFLLFF